MKAKRSVNFIYAVFFITAISATCTLFIVRTSQTVTAEIEQNKAELLDTMILKSDKRGVQVPTGR